MFFLFFVKMKDFYELDICTIDDIFVLPRYIIPTPLYTILIITPQ